EKILEQRECKEGCLDSGVTDEDVFEVRISGDSLDGGSASDGDGGDANEESARCPQELQGITEVMNTATWVQLVSGVGDDSSSTMTRETTIVSDRNRPSGDSSASYIATSETKTRPPFQRRYTLC
ncbi:hypothetical protein F444_22678, partial [Phytophthora nicotianae P1976]